MPRITKSKLKAESLGFQIQPTLTLTVDKTVVSSGETVTLSGFLSLPENIDVDKDGVVDLKEIFGVMLAYGAVAGDPRYNPAYDVNRDGKIDLKDFYTFCLMFGQTVESKPIQIYKSLDGMKWAFLTSTLTTVSPKGFYSINYTVTETPPATIYFKAYFPGGTY